jgi:L-threonylcarbamoyladenylate synthase
VEIQQVVSAEVSALKKGGLIVYPTEAVWGIGCDPRNETAVMSLLNAKQRDVEKGLILIASDYSQLLPYVDENKLTADRKEQIFSTWPGPYTWLFPAAKGAPSWITGGSELIAVRVTSHPSVVRMCNEFSGAIVSTSANITGTPTEHSLENVKQVFGEQVEVYVNEQLGGNNQASIITNSLTGEVIRG